MLQRMRGGLASVMVYIYSTPLIHQNPVAKQFSSILLLCSLASLWTVDPTTNYPLLIFTFIRPH